MGCDGVSQTVGTSTPEAKAVAKVDVERTPTNEPPQNLELDLNGWKATTVGCQPKWDGKLMETLS